MLPYFHSKKTNTPKKLKLYLIIVAIIFLVIFLLKIFLENQKGTYILTQKNILNVELPINPNFAGEALPLNQFDVREAWEKDIFILLGQDYQNLLYIKRSGKYFDYITKELDKRGLPQDLKYLAVAESALIETSKSSAGAAGIWQFIPGTGKQEGLIINQYVDERLNFEKATHAALNYLEKDYKRFNNWSLTAAAYNAGFNNILNNLIIQKVDNYHDLFLNPETARYIFRIVAIKTIMENPGKFGYDFKAGDYFKFPNYKKIQTNEIKDLVEWAQQQGTTYRMIKKLNPWILKRELPAGNWTIKVAK